MDRDNVASPSRTVSRFIETVLLVAAIGLVARFALFLPHPAKWDSLWPLVQLRRVTDPLLAWMAAQTHVVPASPLHKYLPLVAAIALLLVRFVLRAMVRASLVRAARRRAAPPAPVPGSAFATGAGAAQATGARSARSTGAVAAGGAPVAAASGRTVAQPQPPPAAGPESLATVDLVRSGEAVMASPGPGGRTTAVRAVPQRVGRYEVIAELGRGAMGVVYKARDPQIGRLVAIKAIIETTASEEEIEEFKQRFRREAQAAGQLTHPGIVAVYDLIETDAGEQAIVMEFVEGTTLEHEMTGERLPVERVAEIVIQVSEALDFAHSHGIIHRDIKPANILIAKDGRAKISDFGIAKLADSKLTRTGIILGTPAFMSPEQFSGAAVDSRSDIFSLGSILYWMCTGEQPFPGETITAIAYKVMHVSPVAAHEINPALGADIDLIIARCLAKNPGQRYPRAGDLAADLAAFKAGRPLSSSTRPATGQGASDRP